MKDNLEEVKLDLSNEELARVISDYYHMPFINFKECLIEPFKKGWRINSGIFLANLKYSQNFDDIIPPTKLIIKKYKGKFIKINQYKKDDSYKHYLREKEMYYFANQHCIDIEDMEIIRTFVKCYNNKIPDLDKKRVLIIDYGGVESEEEIIKISLEIENLEKMILDYKKEKSYLIEEIEDKKEKIEKELKNLLKSGLKTTSLFHVKSKINREHLFKLDKHSSMDYYKKISGDMKTIFTSDYEEKLPRPIRSSFKSSLEALSKFYSGEDENSKSLLTIIHGDMNNRNILINKENNRAVFVDGGHIKEGISTVDISKQIINDIVYMPLNKIEEIIYEGYFKEKIYYDEKYKIKSPVINENFLIGASMITSFIKILRYVAYRKKFKEEFPDEYKRLLINEPLYRVSEFPLIINQRVKLYDTSYNINLLKKICVYTLENIKRFQLDYIGSHIENFSKTIMFLEERLSTENSDQIIHYNEQHRIPVFT